MAENMARLASKEENRSCPLQKEPPVARWGLLLLAYKMLEKSCGG